MTKRTPLSPVLRENVAALAKAFAKANGIKPATVSRKIRGDMHFLKNYTGGKVSVTTKKYDEIIDYFYDNWPENTPMPQIRENL
jgi:hypothetical protein